MRVGLGVDVHAFRRAWMKAAGSYSGARSPPTEASSATPTPTCWPTPTDALLGAAGLEDIGHYFPDTDERFRDADSIGLLREVRRLVGGTGRLPTWTPSSSASGPRSGTTEKPCAIRPPRNRRVPRRRTRHHDRTSRLPGQGRGHSRPGGVPAGTALSAVRSASPLSPTGLLHLGAARTALSTYSSPGITGETLSSVSRTPTESGADPSSSGRKPKTSNGWDYLSTKAPTARANAGSSTRTPPGAWRMPASPTRARTSRGGARSTSARPCVAVALSMS